MPEPSIQVTVPMVVAAASAVISFLWGFVVVLAKANFKMQLDAVVRAAAGNTYAIEEVRKQIRDIERRQQEDREEKIRVDGRLANVQATLEQQGDALDRQTSVLMTRLDQLDIRKASRGEMPAAPRDSRAEIDDPPSRPQLPPHRARLPSRNRFGE